MREVTSRAQQHGVNGSSVDAPTDTNLEKAKRLEGIMAALRRARRNAEDLAIATGTEIVESHGGEVVLVSPREPLARRMKVDGDATLQVEPGACVRVPS